MVQQKLETKNMSNYKCKSCGHELTQDEAETAIMTYLHLLKKSKKSELKSKIIIDGEN